MWALRALPPGLWIRTPHRELALLRIPVARFYGEKLTFAALGLVVVPLLAFFFDVLGLGLPIAIPAIATLGLAVVHVLPAQLQRHRRRQEGPPRVRASPWGVHRPRRPGTQQRLRSTPGDGSRRRGRRLLGLHRASARNCPARDGPACPRGMPCMPSPTSSAYPQLDDLADIMRLSGEEGAASTRPCAPAPPRCAPPCSPDELADANAVGERMSIPGSLLGVVFMALWSRPHCSGCSAPPRHQHRSHHQRETENPTQNERRTDYRGS